MAGWQDPAEAASRAGHRRAVSGVVTRGTGTNDPAYVERQYASEFGLRARRSIYREAFSAENGAGILARHFTGVELRDATGIVTFRDAESIRSYLGSTEQLSRYADLVPELDLPLVTRHRPVVLVARKGA